MAKRVFKYHAKKEDALASFIKKSQKTLQSRHFDDDVVATGQPPQSLRAFLEPLNEKISAIKSKIDNKEITIYNIFESLNDGELQELWRALDGKAYAEDKLMSASHIVLKKELEAVDEATTHIKTMKCNLIQSFVFAFGSYYHDEKGMNFTYDCIKAKRDIEKIQDYRLGVRRSLERRDDDGEIQNENGNCTIM